VGVSSKGLGGCGWEGVSQGGGGLGPLLENWEEMLPSQGKGVRDPARGWRGGRGRDGGMAPSMGRGPGLGHVWNMSGMQQETTLARSQYLVCGRHGLMWARH